MEEVLRDLGIKVNLSAAILVWALLMARVMPLVLFGPFIGGDVVPSQVKLGIGIALSILLFPFVADAPIPVRPIPFVLLMLKELFVGLAIAYIATMAFEAARAAGTFTDTISGANMATVFVPQISQQATLFADLKFQLAIVLFLGLDGHHIVLQALFLSFKTIPLDAWPRFAHGFWPFFDATIRMGAQLLVVAVALAAPGSVAALLTDLTLGLVNRVAPQIQVFFISMAVKPVVVTAVSAAALLVLYERIFHVFRLMLAHLRNAVFLFG